jgi:hypothetical protein
VVFFDLRCSFLSQEVFTMKKKTYATLITLFAGHAYAAQTEAKPSAHHLQFDVSGHMFNDAPDREGSQQINAMSQVGAHISYQYDLLEHVSISVGHNFKQDDLQTDLLDFKRALDLRHYVALDYEFVPSWFLASEFKVKQRYSPEKVSFTDVFAYEAHTHLAKQLQFLGGDFKAELGGTYVHGLLSSKWEVNYGLTWLINDQWQLQFANTNLSLDDITLAYQAADAWKFSVKYGSTTATYLTAIDQVTKIAHDSIEFTGSYQVTDFMSLGFGIDFLGDGMLSQTQKGQENVMLAEHLDNRTQLNAKIAFSF